MGTLIQDLRYGLRMLAKNPGFTAVAVITLALGLGANSAIFTVVSSVLLRPLPYAHPERLFLIEYGTPNKGFGRLPDVGYTEYKKQSRAFEHVAAFSAELANLTGAGEPVVVRRCEVTANFSPTLAVVPALGRTFLPEDENSPRNNIAVLSEKLWRSTFHAEPTIVGRSITLDGISHTVVGIMPAGFGFPFEEEVWSLVVNPLKLKIARSGVIGRLKAGISVRQAQAEMEVIAQHLASAFPDRFSGQTLRMVSLHEQVVGKVRPSLLVLLSAVGFVLLIACANVANLLLARGAGRRQEMAVRASLGAGRLRLARQLLTESILLSFFAGALGILLAVWGTHVFLSLIPAAELPRIREIHMDESVLEFTALISLVTGLLFGILPAVQLSRAQLNESLKQGGRLVSGDGGRTRNVLAVSEMALALVLVIGAGLMIKSFIRLRSVDPGFNSERVLTMTIFPPQNRTMAQLKSFERETLERLATLPGISSVAAVDWLPFGHALVQSSYNVEGQPSPADHRIAFRVAVSSDYFQTLGIHLLRGRYFNAGDDDNAPGVVIIGKTLAERSWPGQDSVGKRIAFQDHPKSQDWLTVVGVVEDVKQHSLSEHAQPVIYQPYLQIPQPLYFSQMVYLVRTWSDRASLTGLMRERLHEVDKNQPVYAFETMPTLVDRSVAEPRFYSRILGAFSALALLIAAVGIYGVMTVWAAQRTHEIGIRVALGAQRSDILRMILRNSLLLISISVGLGLCGAVAVTHVLRSFLFEVKPIDAATFGAVSLLVATVALLASYIPARRATKVDPMVALRYE